MNAADAASQKIQPDVFRCQGGGANVVFSANMLIAETL
jgi:hypothetical protein